MCVRDRKANFKPTMSCVKKIALEVLENGLPQGVVLNVNIPKLNENEIKGIRICRQAKALWIEKFDKRVTPQGRDYYWLTGEFLDEDMGEDTDEWALKNGYVSIVPVQFDMTAPVSYTHLDVYKRQLHSYYINGFFISLSYLNDYISCF